MYTIFRYETCPDYLAARMTEVFGSARGTAAKMAKAIGCQPSYLTQIMKGAANLSLEQAERVNSFLAHGEAESEYFLWMAQLNRAGTASLKKFFLRKMRELAKKQGTLSAKLGVTNEPNQDIQRKYFRVWHYGAIHALISIPEFNSPESVSNRLGLPIKLVTKTLDELVQLGLVNRNQGKYSISRRSIHLSQESSELPTHHVNWRLKAIEKITHSSLEDDLFYSSVITLSKHDFEKLKDHLSKAIKSAKEVIRDSQNEVLASFNVDFFEVR